MTFKQPLQRIGMVMLLGWSIGLAGIAAAQAAPVEPPPPLVPTTVMPGTVDLDKVYKSERNSKKKDALKEKDRKKYGLPAKYVERGHVKKKDKKDNKQNKVK